MGGPGPDVRTGPFRVPEQGSSDGGASRRPSPPAALSGPEPLSVVGEARAAPVLDERPRDRRPGRRGALGRTLGGGAGGRGAPRPGRAQTRLDPPGRVGFRGDLKDYVAAHRTLETLPSLTFAPARERVPG